MIFLSELGRRFHIGITPIWNRQGIFYLCGMGVRIQPTPAQRRVVRGDYLRDMSYPLPPANCMKGLFACNGEYELG